MVEKDLNNVVESLPVEDVVDSSVGESSGDDIIEDFNEVLLDCKRKTNFILLISLSIVVVLIVCAVAIYWYW